MPEKCVALVTGGSRGIGSAIVKELAFNNIKVYFSYNKSLVSAETLVEELLEFDKEIKGIKADISKPEEINSLVKNIIDLEGQIDILVNNAGIVSDGPFLMMDEEKWHRVLDINLSGTFLISKIVGKYMIKRKTGRIINISSVVAKMGGKGQANYIASKAAIEGLTRALAIELAPRGILVNAIAPGVIETEMTSEIREKYSEHILNKILLKRIGKPEDVSGVVAFLCSPAANYITGQVITVDGGMLFNS